MATKSSRKAYADYLDARDLSPLGIEEQRTLTPGARKRAEMANLEKMQRAIVAMLRAGEALPDEVASDLAYALECLCAGVPAELLQPVTRHGGKRELPIVKPMQAAAIRYLRWVEDGRIKDRRPTATVAEAYGVTDRTVRGWNSAWRTAPTPSISEAFGEPGYGEALGNEEKKLANVVTKFMEATAKNYRMRVGKPLPSIHGHRGRGSQPGK